MIFAAFAAAALVSALPARAGTPASAPAAAASQAPAAASGIVSLSLIEALTAIRQPQLSGVFSFIAEQNSSFAFADLLARDKKAQKLYLEKLDDDVKAADGLTTWDHEVCASLVNLYASPLAATFGKPDDKRMSKINRCVLARVVPLGEIVSRRKQ